MDRPHLARRLSGVSLSASALVLTLAGCQQIQWVSDDGGDDDDAGSTWHGEVDGSSSYADQSGPNPETDSDDAGSTGPKLDTPSGMLPACTLVDLLFVIDDSNSMASRQDNLIASFDGLIAGIQANLDEVNDVHVGVITTDAYAFNEPGCQSLGALVTQTEKASCGPWSAGRFITLADDLATAFPCAAEVGIAGDIEERQIEALLRAAGPEYAGVGGCNEGFIRDDALLVVVVITDEDDGSIVPGEESSVGDPPQWFDELVAIKGGIESNAVVLALIGRPLPNDCNPNDTFTAKVGHRILRRSLLLRPHR